MVCSPCLDVDSTLSIQRYASRETSLVIGHLFDFAAIIENVVISCGTIYSCLVALVERIVSDSEMQINPAEI